MMVCNSGSPPLIRVSYQHFDRSPAFELVNMTKSDDVRDQHIYPRAGRLNAATTCLIPVNANHGATHYKT